MILEYTGRQIALSHVVELYVEDKESGARSILVKKFKKNKLKFYQSGHSKLHEISEASYELFSAHENYEKLDRYSTTSKKVHQYFVEHPEERI